MQDIHKFAQITIYEIQTILT